MSEPAIVVQELRKSVGSSFCLGPLSLSIPTGVVCALIGPNGAGKTTLMNLLMGTGPADGGCARVFGHDVTTDSVEVKRLAALVSPEISYRAWGTVGRAIDFVSGFYPDWDRKRCADLLGQMGLRRSERVDGLSFGGRVKLSLILALARNARLLLLDEPSVGLDPLARRQLYAELFDFIRDERRTVVISSHQLAELERCADHVVVVNDGQLVASGATPDLLSRYTELDVLLRNGQRARLLWDQAQMQAARPAGNEVQQIIGERPLTLEELLVALVKSKSAVRWRPRMGAA
ncbi:MAG TPA: ABC transporter ATP-binding protein [Steroidobacteraceae bacterium]|jgi:ABC-2 type transport system ATP-binding protein